MLEKLDTVAVAKMAQRVSNLLTFLGDLHNEMLASGLKEIKLNTGNFDLYFGKVEEWKTSAEAKKKKTFADLERTRERERKGRERARLRIEREEKKKKSR